MKKNVYKLVIGAILAALSVVLKLTFDLWISIPTFGFPFYGIPLALAGILLGPIYGFMVAVVADTTFGLVMGYMPLFVFSSIAWGVIPSLFKVRKHISYWVLIILLTYVVASLANSAAMWIYFGFEIMMKTFYFRLALIPLFTPIIAIISKLVYERMIDFVPMLNIQEKV
ncbi:MAG: ECF transporter S component [Acholeplasmataceae bacterium]